MKKSQKGSSFQSNIEVAQFFCSIYTEKSVADARLMRWAVVLQQLLI